MIGLYFLVTDVHNDAFMTSSKNPHYRNDDVWGHLANLAPLQDTLCI